MTERDTLLEFPCQFSIKAIGRGKDLAHVVYALIQPQVPEFDKSYDENVIRQRPSGKGNYIAITCTFTATSLSQLDTIYQALTDCEQVIMAL